MVSEELMRSRENAEEKDYSVNVSKWQKSERVEINFQGSQERAESKEEALGWG